MGVDREKVVKGLECCKTYATCNECPYNGEEQNCNSLRREALALIKEQQELIDTDKEELQKRCDELGKELNDAVELIRKKNERIEKLLKQKETQKFFVDESGKITPLPVVVRCKDCHYRGLEERPILCQVMADDWFCADGRRKEETYEFKASCEDGSGTYRGT